MMSKFSKISILCLCFVSLAGAFDWPIKNFQDKYLVKAFGEAHKNKFFPGVAIAGGGTTVYPVGTGEVIFYQDYEDTPYPQTLGPGKYIVIQHGKIRSYYGYLKSLMVQAPFVVDQQRGIGEIGNSGSASREHLFLSLKKEGTYINPFTLFKGAEDKKPPIIKDIIVKSGFYQKLLSPQATGRVALPLRSSYDIFINAFDEPEAGRSRRQLKTLKVYISDSQGVVFEKIIDFDTIVRGKLGGLKTVQEIYARIWNENFIFAGKWEDKERREVYTLKVIAIDQGNNRTVAERVFYFR
ncbi:MAG: hypothetical protein CVV50_02300 [Spirochaetae bacterium HGW-Spirochaetae-6]|nr:MAG: hypothetical protein CVV50_02300 [Spirochaetae bacterium HGW-Spirochaetae-6]